MTAIRENAATATGRRVMAAAEARDFDALADLFAADYTEHIQRPEQPAMQRDEVLAGLRALFEHADGQLQIEPMTTLGERLQLHRTHIAFRGADGEPSSIDYISVVEVDADGRLLRTEAFDVDRLDDAMARLHERDADSS
jgi:hypothetical protein